MPNLAKNCFPWYSNRSTGPRPPMLSRWYRWKMVSVDGGVGRRWSSVAGEPARLAGSARPGRLGRALAGGGVLGGFPLVEGVLQPAGDRLHGRAGGEDLADALALERDDV